MQERESPRKTGNVFGTEAMIAPIFASSDKNCAPANLILIISLPSFGKCFLVS